MNARNDLPAGAAASKFAIGNHPHHPRLRHVTVDPAALEAFFSE
jgi:glutarate dioxygenase